MRRILKVPCATVLRVLALVALLASTVIPLASAEAPTRSYLILAEGNALPSGLARGVQLAGGTVTRTTPEIGLAAAKSSSPSFAAAAARIPGVRSVIPDIPWQWADPSFRSERASVGTPTLASASGEGDFLSDLQWGLKAIDAPGAWEQGARGAGVRVAVLDTGFDLDHPDLAANVNYALSRSFVESESLEYGPADYGSHGTFVAGIIAAADNELGVIGVAPAAELVLVKVMRDDGVTASLADILAGIVYAADVDADVINMSLRAIYPRSGICVGGDCISASDVAEMVVATGRATTYAYQHGSVLIAAVGNESVDLDHLADRVVFPAESPHVIAVSATGPKGWGLDPSTNLDVPAFYTNYGQSLVDLAAPGGNVDDSLIPGEEADPRLCTVGPATAPCFAFDLMYGTTSLGGWGWGYGTSMAAPHVSGVAALIVGKAGGSMRPADVEAALRRSADDLGKPGRDDYYGQGRVNAERAVR